MSLTWNKRKRISIFTGDYDTPKINTNENSEVKVRGEKAWGQQDGNRAPVLPAIILHISLTHVIWWVQRSMAYIYPL